jgi:hypothetical protein
MLSPMQIFRVKEETRPQAYGVRLASAKIKIDYVKSGRIGCWDRFHNEDGHNSAMRGMLVFRRKA